MNDVPATLDRSVLDRLVESVAGDTSFVADLVETYLADTVDQLGAIDAAIAAGDAASLVRPAHTLKSSSLTIGAVRLGEMSRVLEQHGRTGDLVGVEREAAAARSEWPAVQAELRDWLAEAGYRQ